MTRAPEPQWEAYDRENKKDTAPTAYELVWIVAEGDITFGYFDGFTFRLWSGTDDIHVTHWAYIDYPDSAPEEPEDDVL